MPNAIKYNVSAETLALKKGNFWIGTGDVGKGPTSSTGYYNGITPPTGGYTIYLNKESGGPSIYTVTTEAQMVSLTNTIGAQSFTTSGQCLNWFATQTDKMIFNRDYEPIITNGLVLCLDANFTPSYPQSGTTVYSLGTSTNGTLINGCNWVNSGTTSYFNLDGTDDYISLSSNVLFGSSRTFTLQIFGMFQPNPNAFVGPLRINGTLCFYDPSSKTSGYSGGSYRLAYPYPSVNYMSMSMPVNQYFSLTLTNLDSQTPSVQGFSVNNSTLSTSNYTGRIEATDIRIGFADAPAQGRILKVLAYNRVLSQSEIAQNTFTYPMNLSGLVLGVDASNPLSYQQGSTTWYDLSGNQNNFTLNNGVGYSNNLLTFDGVDDYAKITGITGYGSTTTLTVIIVCKWGSGSGMLFGVSSSYDVGYSHYLGFNTAQGNVYAKSYNPPSNTTVHYTFVMRSSGYGANAVTNNLIYVNGVLQTDEYTGSPGNNTLNNFGSNFQISSWPDRGDTYYQNCSVGACFIYNRELTYSEVVQNYSQMQTKFNL
jgi:hypothetical protein